MKWVLVTFKLTRKTVSHTNKVMWHKTASKLPTENRFNLCRYYCIYIAEGTLVIIRLNMLHVLVCYNKT